MSRAALISVACAALLLAGCGGREDDLVETGPNPAIPQARETLVPSMNIAQPAGWGDQTPVAPDGFTVTAMAADLRIPRQMLALPNGDILISEGRGGNAPALRPKDVLAGLIKKRGTTQVEGGDRITLLRDADNDGRPEVRTIFIDNLNAPYGLAFIDGYVYVANQDALVRFPYQEGQTRITAPAEEVTKLPAEINHHWTKALTRSADGLTLYVGIGSNSNVGERGMAVEEERAVVWAVDPATGAHRTVARGLRNPTALAIEPQTSALWAVVNERDEIGPQASPDYLTTVREGAFYGWPYSYWGRNV
ncbi:MAG: PQQ-dependent sugar dehydrogenase, partial [Brevundimonas sp.]